MAAKPKAKSVGIVLNRMEDSVSTFLLRVPKVHNITDGATVRIVESNNDIVTAYEWIGTVAVAEIVDPKKKTGKVFDDKVAVLQVTCKSGVEGEPGEPAAKAKKRGKAVRPKRDLGDPGDIIVIDVTITNPSGELLELPDIAGLIP